MGWSLGHIAEKRASAAAVVARQSWRVQHRQRQRDLELCPPRTFMGRPMLWWRMVRPPLRTSFLSYAGFDRGSK
eukprot:2589074-Pleurochrysis_carterae.AAC.2